MILFYCMLAEDPALLSTVKRRKVVSRFYCRTIQGKAVRVLQMIALGKWCSDYGVMS